MHLACNLYRHLRFNYLLLYVCHPLTSIIVELRASLLDLSLDRKDHRIVHGGNRYHGAVLLGTSWKGALPPTIQM